MDAAFNQVMDHLRPTGVEQSSLVYAPVLDRIV